MTDPRYIPDVTKMSHIVSEFATADDAEAHDRWFRAKVEAALASKEPPTPHDILIAEVKEILDARRDAQSRLAG